jgi:hypothetical protein
MFDETQHHLSPCPLPHFCKMAEREFRRGETVVPVDPFAHDFRELSRGQKRNRTRHSETEAPPQRIFRNREEA